MKRINTEYKVTMLGLFLCVLSVYLIRTYMTNKSYAFDNKINTVKEIAKLPDTTTTTHETTTSSTTSTTTTTTTTVPTTTITTTTTTTKPVETTKKIIAAGSEVVWNNLTREELNRKLNTNLYDTMAETGTYFTEYAAKTGLDPVLAVSIVNLETGCKWGCSSLVTKCYNIGGLKGSPSCKGGYMKYNSLEEGINGYLDILYNNYWLKGLTTPELMNSKYAESDEWAKKVNVYYETIMAS